MKFPYTLSEDRLALLSPQDRELYEYEHSIFYSNSMKKSAFKKFKREQKKRQSYYLNAINEDSEYNDMSESEKDDFARELSVYEAKAIYRQASAFMAPYCKNLMSDKQYEHIMEKFEVDFYKMCNTEKFDKDIYSLNEAGGTTAGHDMTFWIPGMDWLFSLSTSLLGTCLTGMAWLIMAGKDKICAHLLERYMNKLVELTDNGVNKKKPWYAIFGGSGGKNHADKSKSCFRTIQECVERDMCINTMIAAKACGFFGQDAIGEMESGNITDGGLLGQQNSFYSNVGQYIEKIAKNKS